jgi:hypothetical protein
MTTGLLGPYDLVAAIVVTILAGVLVLVSVYTPTWLGWCLRILAAFVIIVAARAAWTGFADASMIGRQPSNSDIAKTRHLMLPSA